jgi:hypothetical protein
MTREDIIPYISDACNSYILRVLGANWVPYNFNEVTVGFKNNVTNEIVYVTGDTPEGLLNLLTGEN